MNIDCAFIEGVSFWLDKLGQGDKVVIQESQTNQKNSMETFSMWDQFKYLDLAYMNWSSQCISSITHNGSAVDCGPHALGNSGEVMVSLPPDIDSHWGPLESLLWLSSSAGSCGKKHLTWHRYPVGSMPSILAKFDSPLPVPLRQNKCLTAELRCCWMATWVCGSAIEGNI